MNFSFLHVSDIHFGRVFSNVNVNDSFIIKALSIAFSKMIDFAITKKVDFVLFAGDTFDSTTQDLYSKLFFKKELTRLEQAGIKTILVCGNHDPLNSYNKSTFDYDENSLIKIVGLNTENKTKITVLNKEFAPCAIIHALSFETTDFCENPTIYFQQPTIDEKSLFNIGLLHCDLNAEKNSPYAPCTITDLKNLNYDYWALGHIHTPREIEKNIIYSGTIQGRNSKESDAHGFRFISVENGVIKENTFVSSDIIRYLTFEIDLSGTNKYDNIDEYIAYQINNHFVENKECEMFLIKLILSGKIENYSFLNEKLKNITSDISIFNNNKIVISEIENRTKSKVDYDNLKTDIGLVGEIISTIDNNDTVENIYIKLNSMLEKVCANCFFDTEEKELLKLETITKAKESCLEIASVLYENESIN